MHMRRRRRKPRSNFRRHWERFGFGGPLLWTLAGMIAALLLIRTLEVRLRPIVSELASAEVQNAVTAAITDTVTSALEAEKWTYSDMVTVQRNENGQITALQSNVAEANLLRSKVVAAVLEQVSALDAREFDIALGSLFDFDIFSGRGPSIRVRTLRVGSVDAAFESVFSSAGINQTRHQIMLEVTVPVTIFIAASTVKTDVTASICVAETVIVGEVPSTYLQLPTTQ